MRLSNLHLAKGYKFKMMINGGTAGLAEDLLIRIDATQKTNEFVITPFGENVGKSTTYLCNTVSATSDYLRDLFDSEVNDIFKNIFLIEGVDSDFIDVQAYNFRTMTSYKTPIIIQVPEKVLEKTTLDRLYNEYVWTQLGQPALFSLNYTSRKKQNADVRFVSGKRYLAANNTPRGIIARSEIWIKEKYDLPVDVYIAPEIKFVAETEQAFVNGELSTTLDQISNPASYFARWDAYNELTYRLIEKEIEEFGEIPYKDYSLEIGLNGCHYTFELTEDLDESFVNKEVCIVDREESVVEGVPDRINQTDIGRIVRIGDKKLVAFLSDKDDVPRIPKAGKLGLYTAGDKSILKRRTTAKERMIKGRSPIKGIVTLIEAGASGYTASSEWGSHPGITNEFRDNFRKAANLNSQQVVALEKALNTPDIALIQGPPGTGKTTVIKAIAERFREIYEAEEKAHKGKDEEYQIRSPKILISSFQNDAVDHAISAPLPGDIPAYRKTAKRSSERIKEQYQKTLDDWYESMTSSVRSLVENETANKYVETRKELEDEFFSYKNSGESIEKAAELIKHYLSFVDIKYPPDLLKNGESIINAAKNETQTVLEDDPIIARLNAQRITKESFSDDGVMQARRLLSHLKLRDDLQIGANEISSIEQVIDNSENPDVFEKYASTVERLRNEFCSENKRINVKDSSQVRGCILEFSTYFNNHFSDLFTDQSSKKSLILSEFLDRMEQEYETVVKKYSMTTAATCQTSLTLGIEETYDLVIVDEAARANPLDLFIPMSMAKKIILVGDHKQLPHMLEPDVLKILQDDPKYKDIPDIEVSLFERLFGMFSEGLDIRAIPLTHQYRMHPDICRFVSEAFYDGKLLSADEDDLKERRKSPREINEGKALTFVNIPFAKGGETKGASKSRSVEVEAIVSDVQHILEVEKDSQVKIGIITFYQAQVAKINEYLEMRITADNLDRIEVGTVDAFQGKEYEYVLLSCVRSNPADKEGKHSVGFLEKPNRLCVAFSRAQKQLITYGDADTLMQIPCFERLSEICLEEGGCYREY